ncbi:MAG: 6-phosphofructokinase [Clostridia bacterium]|nr:6-phosphofructokinase [Clostridia bacterium]
MRLGILTSGGDCPGLNAVIRGFCKYAFNNIEGVEIYGIEEGYLGLIEKMYRPLYPADVENILDLGGTILGSTRTPYKQMTVTGNGERTRLQAMVENYKKLKLDGLIALGGAGTHKTASLLSVEGCNVIGLPKTIDNDIYGTDVTFGFHTAVQTAADCIKRIRTTADSHSRVFFVEVMGNKVGWLTLYSGIAGGADAIFIPEISYSEAGLAEYLKKRKEAGCRSTIIAVAEGAISDREAAMNKKERKDYLASVGNASAAVRCATVAELNTGISCRSTVLGHIQRGGDPSAYDKVLSTEIGAYGAQLAKAGKFGVTVCVRGSKLSYNSLTEIAGRTKYVPADSQMVTLAKDIGIYFGEQ